MIYLLDMDDTLLDFARAERENLKRTFSAFGVPQEEALFRRFHEINDSLWRELERGEMTRERLKILRFRRLFGEFSLPADADAAARFYFDGFPAICFPFEGALSFLRELKRRGRVYIVTNGSAHIQREHVRLAGFGEYLDGLIISEELGADKPSQAFVDGAVAAIGNFRPEACAYLGDSLTSDGKCAERMGVKFVLFAPRGAPAGYCGAVAENYGEALTLLG